MIKIFKFRKNDLNPSQGKQIEFNQNVAFTFFGFTENEVEICVTYKSLLGNDRLNNKKFKNYLKLSPSRGDYKIYSNSDGTENIKDLFIQDLKLNEQNNLDDYFALVKKDSQNFELFYLPRDTSISKFLATINNNAFQLHTSNEDNSLNGNKENPKVDLLDKFANWLNKNPKSNYFENDYNKTIKGLEKINEKYIESFGENLFVINKLEIFSIVDRIENNIRNKETQFWNYSEASSTHVPRAILNKNNYQRFLIEYYFRNEKQGFNRIYFGPPGTGKSFEIKEKLKALKVDPENYSRVTFHPDYDYHSFVGGYKPFTDREDGDKIKYKFVPQIFIDLYVKAWSNLDEDYYLLIEEINRGNCAEIFGDIFQLLDRNPEYNIEPSSELKAYLKELENIKNKGKENSNSKIKLLFDDKLQMPNNLSILASMNTSDQSLYPMDSAFKRRWDWEYVPINLNCTKSNFIIQIDVDNQYSWLKFLEKVNQRIYNVTKSEDKQLGNWFINAYDKKIIDKKLIDSNENTGNLFTGIISKKLFINKVLFYLWNDVFKDEVFHPENIFIEKSTDGTKNRGISFNNFYNKDEQDRLLIHLLSDVLNVPIVKSEYKEAAQNSQESQVVDESAETNEEEYKENKSESEE